ncbi:hypothetical protein SELMODRAFT_431832 [Selaginella moellendorffii]|uniref:Sec16 Sec23-binding domain-containing protein n=1 Tax=Selaginella moellendorffii TaxID=88036 RepID=D8TDY3_SELML|nr:hypothetical protein SELMODRAFT_431832 [Selaginella moellendorffii]
MQATAFEVKRLLIAGKQKEALRAAQDGQLWGCALLMARQLGEKYTDTIVEMAQRNTNSSNVTALQPQPVPASAVDGATQDAVEGMLEEWQENLAIMAVNRTNGDERVIMHLGDCLWRHRDEICGAHICYRVANASFEPFSTSAGLCLIAADHCIHALGHAADVCKEAAVALEERLRIHSQGGSTSIVQRFFGNIGLHKMIGPSSPKASDMLILITVLQQLIVSPTKGTPNRDVFTSFVQRAMGFIKTPSKEAKLGDSNKFRYDETLKRWVEEGAEAQAPELPLAPPPTANKLVSRVEENGAPISMSPERRQPTPERPQPVVSGIPHSNLTSVTPSKTSSDSPPLFGVVPKASAKPLAAARFFVPAAAAAAAPDINSNHSVDPSSAPAFVPDTAFSNGNGPFAAAAFAQPVVQDMRNDPGPTPDHLSSGSSPAMFYLNHYPAAPLTISLPPPPSSGSHSASDGRAAAAKPTPGKFDSSAINSPAQWDSKLPVPLECLETTCKRWNCKSHSTSFGFSWVRHYWFMDHILGGIFPSSLAHPKHISLLFMAMCIYKRVIPYLCIGMREHA